MIPVHAPVFGAREAEYAMSALRSGDISGSGGWFIGEFERRFADYCDCRYGVAVNSGTSALHLAARLANIERNDEVLTSASTNIASANAVVVEGGIVVPIDAEPDTWNMNVALLDDAVSRRTRAIMAVHLYGHPVDMCLVMPVAKRHHLFVIEDCAEAHGATYQGQKVGSFGDVGCFSFYANKVITCGEGGMLVTNRADLADRARSLRNLAFATPRFRHDDVGYNYRMTNVAAAIGLAQFERIEETIAAKRLLAERYTARLQGVTGLRLPVERNYARNVYWMYALVVEPEFGISRDALMAELRDRGVETRTMFCPMHLQPSLVKRGAVRQTSCPIAEDLWANGLYLPSGCALTDADVAAICTSVETARRLCA